MDPTQLDAGILDELQGYIITQFATFGGALGPYHQFMFGLFVFIVIVLLGAKITRDLQASWLLMTKLVTICIAVWFCTNWVGITDIWAKTMVWAGTNAGGNHMPTDAAFSASRVFAYGMKVSGGIIKAAFNLKAVFSVGGWFIAWTYGACAVLTLCAFGFMAIQIFIATTLFQILVMISLFMLPFMVWKRMAFLVEPAFAVIAGYGVSLMVLAALMNLVVGFGEMVTPRLAEFTLTTAASAAMYALSSMFLGIYGRKVATEMISGSPSLGAEEALNNLAASARALATVTGAAVAAGIGATAIAGAASRSARAALAGGASAASGEAASVSGIASTSSSSAGSGGSGSASNFSPQEMAPIRAANAMHQRFQASIGEVSQKGERISDEQGEKMGNHVGSLGYKRVAREMQASVGQQGGLSSTAATRLRERMDGVQQQHTANVNSGMDSTLAAGIANNGYRSAVEEAASSLKADGPVTSEDARESAGMHTLSDTTTANDLMLANRMGIVGEIRQAAIDGQSTRETMERLGDKMKPIEDAAIMNGSGAEADVHKMGIINSVRETLGVPADKEGAQTWAKEQSVERGAGQAATAVVPVSGAQPAVVSLRATNTNEITVPNWVKRAAAGRIMPTNTTGHGSYRTGNIAGDN